MYFFDDGAKIQSFLNIIKLSEIGSVRLESTEILKKQQEVEERKYGMNEKRLKKIHEDFEKVMKQGGRYYEKSEYKAKSLLQEKPALFRTPSHSAAVSRPNMAPPPANT